MAKKSAAQIRRMEQRALERGATYEAPPSTTTTPTTTTNDTTNKAKAKANNAEAAEKAKAESIKYQAALKLKQALDEIEKNSANLNAKEKRSAKRKAEAIALEIVKEHGQHVNVNDNVNVNAPVSKDTTVDETANVDETTTTTENESKAETDLTAEELLSWLEQQKDNNATTTSSKSESAIPKKDHIKLLAAKKYHSSLVSIEENQNLNSKDRRSAKKKAEAIAKQDSKVENGDLQELLDWYEENKDRLELILDKEMGKSGKKRKAKDALDGDGDGEDATGIGIGIGSKRSNPYILFVGQIPFHTTAQELLTHFQKYMGKQVITTEAMKIRIPKDEKVKDSTKDQDKDKSKGFAFCEFQDPELMYECLKMHQTPLNGRRINVIRAAGGGKAARTETHKQRKLEQDEYISTNVDKIIKEYLDQGKLKEGELDSGAILICKRRSAATVEAALSQYIEQRAEKELDNPSAFFMNVMLRVTEAEGEGNGNADGKRKQGGSGKGRGGGNGNSSSGSGNRNSNGNSKSKSDGGDKPVRSRDASVFTKSGVDMSISEKNDDGDATLSKIFPSMGRGRGRGRGAYMNMR